MENEVYEAVKQSILPVGISALTLFNVQLANWVYLLTMYIWSYRLFIFPKRYCEAVITHDLAIKYYPL